MIVHYRVLRNTCIFKEYETHFITKLFLGFSHGPFMILCLILNTNVIWLFMVLNQWQWMIGRHDCNFMSHTRNRLRVTFYTIWTCINIIKIVMETSSKRMTILTKNYEHMYILKIMFRIIYALLLWIYMQSLFQIWLRSWS